MLAHLIFVPNVLAIGVAKATESKNPRESSYVRTDDWDDEAVKWYEKADQREKDSA